MENNQKPEWITVEQWGANPNIYHWEQTREAMEYREQTKNRPPITHEQAVQQARRNRISLGLDPLEYDRMLNEQE